MNISLRFLYHQKWNELFYLKFWKQYHASVHVRASIHRRYLGYCSVNPTEVWPLPHFVATYLNAISIDLLRWKLPIFHIILWIWTSNYWESLNGAVQKACVHTIWHLVPKMDEIFFGEALGSNTTREPIRIDFCLHSFLGLGVIQCVHACMAEQR